MDLRDRAEDPMWLAWKQAAPRVYDRAYYSGNPLVAWVNTAGHRVLEAAHAPRDRFGHVLEVGAGTGFHLEYVRHRFDRYVMSDISEPLLAQAAARHRGRAGVEFSLQDATRLEFPDASFDRVISVYNLEHLPEPHRVLQEWYRVLRGGGVLSIAIPLDGGVAWRLGRHLTTRRFFRREGLDLDYIVAREHVNPSYNLIALIRHYFGRQRERWFPFGLPSVDLNLVYCCTVRKDSAA